jgi:hypothetical protein
MDFVSFLPILGWGTAASGARAARLAEHAAHARLPPPAARVAAEAVDVLPDRAGLVGFGSFTVKKVHLHVPGSGAGRAVVPEALVPLSFEVDWIASQAVSKGGSLVTQEMSTTAGLRTRIGTIFGRGAGANLSGAQKAALGPGQFRAWMRNADAEITTIYRAVRMGVPMEAVVANRNFCPACYNFLVRAGATIEGQAARAAVFKGPSQRMSMERFEELFSLWQKEWVALRPSRAKLRRHPGL